MRSPKVVLIVTIFAAVSAGAFGAAQKAPQLTDQDRAQIQQLVASYARALGTCAAEEYADLFSPDAVFASGPRGEVRGREKLIALVQSERQCNDNSAKTPRAVPTVTIEPSLEGARGKALAGTTAYYDDVYVKTAQGWRFKSRSVITAQEEAARLTAQDFFEIRRLGGNDAGQFEDVYSNGPEGRRFRSSGITVAVSPAGVTGKAYLKGDGGHYEDVYARTRQGWRFQSRAYVPPASGAAATP